MSNKDQGQTAGLFQRLLGRRNQDGGEGSVEVNAYGRQLSAAEMDRKIHRDFVGGMWDEIGALQFDFLKSKGLKPSHHFLDVGCGALRGGIHFVRYLDEGHYCGFDINASLIHAGEMELKEAGLASKHPRLLVDNRFEASRFQSRFDYAIALSVFTHLPMNSIIRCMVEVRKVLQPNGTFFASFFEAPSSAHLNSITHLPGGTVSHYDADPYHYSFDEFKWMARSAGMRVEIADGWAHPRSQKMLALSIAD